MKFHDINGYEWIFLAKNSSTCRASSPRLQIGDAKALPHEARQGPRHQPHPAMVQIIRAQKVLP
jgi:hypothetical protein